MKGIIFTEFIDIVEDQFGLAICQQMLDDAKDEGIYTAVGSYEHTSLVKLILALSRVTQNVDEMGLTQNVLIKFISTNTAVQ